MTSSARANVRQTQRRRRRDNMTPIGDTVFLLFLLYNTASPNAGGTHDEPELVFRPEGGVVELGYCFGVDYIVISRASSDGDQLLENSSADAKPFLPPADLQGRVNTSSHHQLFGLQISNLRHSDSRIYSRECWQNEKLVNRHRMRLTVCNEEVGAMELRLLEDGGVELLCNSSFVGLDGATIRWYRDVHPSYKTTLLLDSGVSLEPLGTELQGVVGVRDRGASLHIPNMVLQDGHNFHCSVMKGETCLSFQNIYLPDSDGMHVVFASPGDQVTLECGSVKSQRWETPLGNINTTTKRLTAGDGSTMHIVGSVESKNYSLFIPAVSDQYSGDYSCFGPSLVAYYSLRLCPKSEYREEHFFEGMDVSLKCDGNQEQPGRAQWHRGDLSGQNSLIDTRDKSIPIPADLRGRVTLSEDGSVLKLSGLTMKDAGVYWCVVIEDLDLLVIDYEDEDTEDFTEDDGYPDDLEETYRCLFKQETLLMLSKERTPDPSPPANTTAYALGAVLVGSLVAAVIGAVLVMKRRPKTMEAVEMEACSERLSPTTNNY